MSKSIKKTKTASKTRIAAKKVRTTLGDLIAAAFDTMGNDVKGVTRLLSSREMHNAEHTRIVLV